MPNYWKSSVLAALSLSAASCNAPWSPPSVTITPMGAERTYPARPDSVKIPLSSTRQPECPYDEIAVVTAVGTQSDDQMVAALRNKARTLGADAIIGYTQGWWEAWRVRSGTAIRFRSADCAK